jgi:hypothetical protein
LSSVAFGRSTAQGFCRLDKKPALLGLLFASQNTMGGFFIQLSRNRR